MLHIMCYAALLSCLNIIMKLFANDVKLCIKVVSAVDELSYKYKNL